MNSRERQLAEAAANLTVEDAQWLQAHDMVSATTEQREQATLSHASIPEQVAVSEGASAGKQNGRREPVEHEWPDAGAVLEADYCGQHYEAEVIEAPQYKSGKALKILNGPAAGEVAHSVSGAMLKATEAQRETNDLGRKGVANGWSFWSIEGDSG